MRSHFFAYLARMRFIQRWALMRNTSPENVQEHSHQVAVLAHALAVIRNEKFGGQVDAGAVAVAALYHDATEILTGDMPTPIKYYNPEIRGAYKAVEAVAGDKLLSLLPPEFQATYRPILQPQDETVEQLVKAGNSEFREAAAQTKEALEGYDLPELRYFMATFLESFSLSLDQLK